MLTESIMVHVIVFYVNVTMQMNVLTVKLSLAKSFCIPC